MKYMGSKRAMLQNGLGELLTREVRGAKRFADLFAGSSAVANHVAQKFDVTVLAFDLQRYSVALAEAVLCRSEAINPETIGDAWIERARSRVKSVRIPTSSHLTHATVRKLREWCERQDRFPITRAYGGHYFSPRQAIWLDALRSELPKQKDSRAVALASLVHAASQCAAAPGHTAQPFQPTRTAKPFLKEAWERSVTDYAHHALRSLAPQFARRLGNAEVGNANKVAESLREGDVAFIDPPYSGVHYSRFYHVLETVVLGKCKSVSGVGRYPDPEYRPRSKYSTKTESAEALDDLLKTVSSKGAQAILTFPDHECSNGLSGEMVRDIARTYFAIREMCVKSRFSTLGGPSANGMEDSGRKARRNADELILVLDPK